MPQQSLSNGGVTYGFTFHHSKYQAAAAGQELRVQLMRLQTFVTQ
jgi:hypothetical protein